MKKFKMFMFFALCAFSVSSWAVLPPAYLNVPKWKSCVETVKKGSAKFYCLSSKKPRRCPRASWEQLTEQHMIEACPHH